MGGTTRIGLRKYPVRVTPVFLQFPFAKKPAASPRMHPNQISLTGDRYQYK